MVKCDKCGKEAVSFWEIGKRKLCYSCYSDFERAKEKKKEMKLAEKEKNAINVTTKCLTLAEKKLFANMDSMDNIAEIASDNDNIDVIFEKNKKKLSQIKTNKEKEEIIERIKRELEKNRVEILFSNSTSFKNEDNSKTYFLTIHIPYDNNASHKDKINKLTKKWVNKGLIDTVYNKIIAVYRFRL